MGITQLSSIEIQDLINRYKSELKKLEFQINEVNLTINELSVLLNTVHEKERSALGERVKRRAVRKNQPAVKEAKKRGRPAGKTVKKSEPVIVTKPAGYKLSLWDETVIEVIRQRGSSAITSEIIDMVIARSSDKGLSNDTNEVRKKVVRSLQKLVNKRGDLKKVNFKGKGFSYALPEWLNEKGKLQTEFKR
jgi:uncharacterized phage infection (PIP) family protein YhgE